MCCLEQMPFPSHVTSNASVVPFCNKRIVMLNYLMEPMLIFVKPNYRFSSDFASQNGLMPLEWLKGLWSSKLLILELSLWMLQSNAAVYTWSTKPVCKTGQMCKDGTLIGNELFSSDIFKDLITSFTFLVFGKPTWPVQWCKSWK